ncbi:hypothetical protein GCM10008918_05270 [Lactobacillus kefiranofaciens subsp. kefiranofaciens]|uniref:Uncharacterized protein n=1 Tax=Lactobacillus kefiranofaciens TaxID=267818 RepID=A0ABY0MB33_9LACO|nr:hypothetical protein SAMN02983011_00023 [Lactobacillus kefiranofaciens]
MMTKVELTRFRIKKGKEAKAQEWMDLLNEHHVDTVATMAGEKMYVESVFKEKIQMAILTFTGIRFKARAVMLLKNLKAISIRSILSIGMNVLILNASQLIWNWKRI